MKRLGQIFAFFFVSFLFSTLYAEPFLVSDPYRKGPDQPTEFSIVAGKLSFSVPADKLPDGGVRLKFDLVRLPEGEHILQIKATDSVRRRESPSVFLKVLKKSAQEITVEAPPEAAVERGLIPPSRTPRNLIEH